MTRALALLPFLAACHLGLDGGVVQNGGKNFGGSVVAHAGVGALPKKILVLDLDFRGDVGDDNSRLAFGTSFLGGLPVPGGRIMARAGIWKAPLSSAPEATVVPTFELSYFFVQHTGVVTDWQNRGDRMGPGPQADGFYVGIRDDIDTNNYVTFFVGWALLMVPGP